MKYLLSGTLKTLKAQTESNDTPKIPQRLKGSDPEQLVDFLMQAYRAIVERRGMEYKDITDAEAGKKIAKVVEWLYGPKYRSTLFLQGGGQREDHYPQCGRSALFWGGRKPAQVHRS